MALLTLPKLLDIPSKLLPLADPDVFNQYRIFLLEGGRGGAKSQSTARLLLYLGSKYKLRIACGRETQNSIAESVHALLSDLIIANQLDYDIQASKLIHRVTGTEFTFIGLREQGRFNIQGIEGVDILWIEEGQAVAKATMDIVLPTIRKRKSRIFITMNRHVENDPAYSMVVERDDCLHIYITYLENEHCTPELTNEAAVCKKASQKDYDHIWLGIPLAQSEDAVFTKEEIENGQKFAHIMAPGYGIRVGGFDVARFGDDKCADEILQQMGALHWEEYHVDEWDHKDLNYTTGRILQISNEQGVDGAAIDEDGIGAGPLDTLQKGRGLEYFVGFRNLPYNFKENRFYGNVRTKFAFETKKMFADGHLCIRDKETIKELTTAFKYTFDHYQRKILIDKKVMKEKFKIPSPNRADALIMAVSRIGEVKQKQDRQYEPNTPVYAKDDNLFQIAGVR